MPRRYRPLFWTDEMAGGPVAGSAFERPIVGYIAERVNEEWMIASRSSGGSACKPGA